MGPQLDRGGSNAALAAPEIAEISPRKRIWGWFFFDWANQPFYTLILTFVFGPYFAAVATEYFMGTGLAENVADARAQSVWSLGQTVTGLFIAFTAPILGAFADNTGRRIPWIVAFSVLYVAGNWALWWTMPDGSTLWLSLFAFGIAMLGAEYSLIFVSAMLPDLGDDNEVGHISGSGMALGYLGGVISLFIMLLFFVEQANGKTLIGLDPGFGLLDPAMREGARFVGPFTAIWFIVFMIPFFLWVKDTRSKNPGNTRAALSQLMRSIRSIALNIIVLVVVTAVIVGMSRESFFGIPLAEGSSLPDIVFYILGATIGAAGGALQSASRSMMVRHAHPDRPTEAFGLYALSGKATAFLAPAMIGLVTYLSNSPRIGVSPLIGLFILALFLLRWVKAEGDRNEWAEQPS